MNIQAIWEDGVFRPAQPLALKRRLVTLTVSDDDLVALSASELSTGTHSPALTLPRAGADLLTEIRQVLGPLHRQRPAVSVADDKQALIESLAEKYAQ